MARRHNKFKVYPWLLFQIHKKRRIIGRVQCKNIKTQCPKVTCTDPILLPGRCCKVCPGSEDQSKPYIIISSVTRFLPNEMRKTVPILLPGFSYFLNVSGRSILSKKDPKFTFPSSFNFKLHMKV